MLIRAAEPADAGAIAALQNRIIRIGGTTAYQQERSTAQILDDYIAGPACICCYIAETDAEGLIGFQTIGTGPNLPQGWAGIGTFVSPDIQARGVGQQLFQASRIAAKAAGIKVLNATIRADNVPGLAYYARLGFVDYRSDPAWALENGQVVGRVSRRLDL